MDAALVQDDVMVARSQTLFVHPTQDAGGQVWTSAAEIDLPPATLRHGPGRAYRAGGGDWTTEPAGNTAPVRKRVWLPNHPIVLGEDPSPFELAACAADVTNFVIHWGDRGVEYINADATLAMSRLPVGPGVGVVATQRLGNEGIAIGEGLLFDEEGAFGLTAISALANADRAVRNPRL